ncbi:bifunctional nuclease family protein [Nitrospira defluvii]|nr:bifunctional nuclease family protein [Nitrospira defluvii]
MNIPLKVDTVIADPNTGAQIVILKDEQNLELLPIWVGMAEGNAIRFALEGIISPRPLTHDLLKDFLNHLKIPLEKVLIHSMSGSTYYASLHLIKTSTSKTDEQDVSQENPPSDLQQEPEELTVDARPSDAISLALRMGVPIYVTEEVLRKKGSENLDTWLEKLKPKDFGPYDA